MTSYNGGAVTIFMAGSELFVALGVIIFIISIVSCAYGCRDLHRRDSNCDNDCRLVWERFCWQWPCCRRFVEWCDEPYAQNFDRGEVELIMSNDDVELGLEAWVDPDN